MEKTALQILIESGLLGKVFDLITALINTHHGVPTNPNVTESNVRQITDELHKDAVGALAGVLTGASVLQGASSNPSK